MTPLNIRIRPAKQSLPRLGVVAAMILCLAFTAQHFLSFLATSPALAKESYRVLARGLENDPGTDSGLRLDGLVVGGRPRALDSTDHSSDWTARIWPGSERSSLFNNAALPDHSISFSGAGFLLTGKARGWSGILDVQHENADSQIVEVQASKGRDCEIMFEDPPAPQSGFVLMAALVAFTLVACVCAPWRSDRRVAIWLMCFLALFHVLFWATQCVATTSDSPSYLKSLGGNLAGYPQYFPPGYPAFLGLVELFSGENHGRYIALLQHILAVAAAFWTYLLARRVVPLELALLAGILAGTLSPVSTMSQTVMTEIPTLFAMVGALYFTVRSAETGHYRFAVVAGALTGWGGLLRAVPLAALLPAIGVLLWFSPLQRRSRLAMATLAAAGAIVLLPLSWFAYNCGHLTIANSKGHHLYNRVIVAQKQLDESGPATQTLLRIVNDKDPRQLAYWDLRELPGFRQPTDMEYGEFEGLLFGVAREGFLKDPLAFLAHTPQLAWSELLADPCPGIPEWGNGSRKLRKAESPPPLRLTVSGTQWRRLFDEVHSTVWPLLCWAAIVGAIVGLPLSNRGLVFALAWVPLGYLLSTASLDLFMSRHSLPVIPFVVVLALVAVHVLLIGWATDIGRDESILRSRR